MEEIGLVSTKASRGKSGATVVARTQVAFSFLAVDGTLTPALHGKQPKEDFLENDLLNTSKKLITRGGTRPLERKLNVERARAAQTTSVGLSVSSISYGNTLGSCLEQGKT